MTAKRSVQDHIVTIDAKADSLQTAPLVGHPDVERVVPYPSRQDLRVGADLHPVNASFGQLRADLLSPRPPVLDGNIAPRTVVLDEERQANADSPRVGWDTMRQLP